MRPDIFKGLTPKLKDYFRNIIITCLFHLSKEIHGKGDISFFVSGKRNGGMGQ